MRKKELANPEKPRTTPKKADAQTARVLATLSSNIADWAKLTLRFAKELHEQDEPVQNFSLSKADRAALAALSKVSPKTREKLLKSGAEFTVAEIAGLGMAISKSLSAVDMDQQIELLLISQTLMGCTNDKLAGPEKPARRKPSQAGLLFQFKITLKDSKPPIWRRIQVKDCTLAKLHEHIQTAMGWENSHLHHFQISGKRYGNRKLLDDGFDAVKCIDSSRTKLSQLVPEEGKPFKFHYEYDFGDSWLHEILFEGRPPPEKGQTYPQCIEGARACPPEDVGGVYGYYSYLEALADPKHEDHEQFMEWSGPFDPEQFDPGKATKRMKDGLPDWGE